MLLCQGSKYSPLILAIREHSRNPSTSAAYNPCARAGAAEQLEASRIGPAGPMRSANVRPSPGVVQQARTATRPLSAATQPRSSIATAHQSSQWVKYTPQKAQSHPLRSNTHPTDQSHVARQVSTHGGTTRTDVSNATRAQSNPFSAGRLNFIGMSSAQAAALGLSYLALGHGAPRHVHVHLHHGGTSEIQNALKELKLLEMVVLLTTAGHLARLL